MPSSNVLLDTHILLWILSDSKRLKPLKRLKETFPWVISPVSFLEIKFLQECGRVKLDLDKILEKLKQDDRFRIDDLSVEGLCLKALAVSFTRDPFDRLLVAHSHLRGFPLATCDRLILENDPQAVSL